MSETHRIDHEWHVAINRHSDSTRDAGKPWESMRFMYEAKKAHGEARRLPLLFAMERKGELARTHRQCSMQPPVPVEDNHLTCCLGVECRKCEHLSALDSAKLTPEQIDEAKSWTCIAHIISKGGDTANEGYILTTDDRMFWDRTYESMAGEAP